MRVFVLAFVLPSSLEAGAKLADKELDLLRDRRAARLLDDPVELPVYDIGRIVSRDGRGVVWLACITGLFDSFLRGEFFGLARTREEVLARFEETEFALTGRPLAPSSDLDLTRSLPVTDLVLKMPRTWRRFPIRPHRRAEE